MKRFSKITTTQLARICGVSQGTVDRALHNRGDINPKTCERILEVAREYDYIPSVQNKDQANSMLIGVILFDLYNEFFSKLAMSLVNAANKAGYSVIFQFSNKNEKKHLKTPFSRICSLTFLSAVTIRTSCPLAIRPSRSIFTWVTTPFKYGRYVSTKMAIFTV